MTLSIDPATLAQAQAAHTTSLLLFEFYLNSGTQFFNTFDRPIVYSGATYEPFPVRIGEIRKSSMGLTDTVTLVITNVSRDIATLMLAETFRGRRVVIRRGFLSDKYTLTTPFIVYDGLIDGVSGAEEKDTGHITIPLVTDLAYWQKGIPGRQYQATCVNEFKSAVDSEGGCGYVGAETWCNRTWERCKALSNQANFMGFRHIPMLETAEIWWGRVGPANPMTSQHVGIQVWPQRNP